MALYEVALWGTSQVLFHENIRWLVVHEQPNDIF